MKPNACCNDERNLSVVTASADGSRVHRRCSVCGSNHHEMTVDPVELGTRIASVGGSSLMARLSAGEVVPLVKADFKQG